MKLCIRVVSNKDAMPTSSALSLINPAKPFKFLSFAQFTIFAKNRHTKRYAQ